MQLPIAKPRRPVIEIASSYHLEEFLCSIEKTPDSNFFLVAALVINAQSCGAGVSKSFFSFATFNRKGLFVIVQGICNPV